MLGRRKFGKRKVYILFVMMESVMPDDAEKAVIGVFSTLELAQAERSIKGTWTELPYGRWVNWGSLLCIQRWAVL